MKRFSFGLKSVLNHRNYLEKKAQRGLFNAGKEYMGRKRTVEELGRKKAVSVRKCSAERYRGIDVSRYQLYISFLEKLNVDIERAYTSLEEGAVSVKMHEDALRKALIRKKTLETLKEVQYKRYVKRAAREDQKVLDEMAIIREWRKQ